MRWGPISALGVALATGGCAHIASVGQGADSATTLLGTSQGLVEANPIIAGAPVLLVLKPLLPLSFKYMRRENCEVATRATAVAGFGAAGWNVAILGGVAPPLAAVAGLGTGALVWDASRQGADRHCRPDVAVAETPRRAPALAANPFLEP